MNYGGLSIWKIEKLDDESKSLSRLSMQKNEKAEDVPETYKNMIVSLCRFKAEN